MIGVFSAVFRSAASTFLLVASSMATAVIVLALVGVLGAGLTGAVSLRLSGRRSKSRD